MDGSSPAVVAPRESEPPGPVAGPAEFASDERSHAFGVTVVIPVRGRAAMLRATLAGLDRARRYCTAPVEVLVVDDSATAARRANEESCRVFGARMVNGPRSVAAKRNLGARLARHDLLLFIDSDCVPAPDLLNRHLAAIRRAPDRVAGIAGLTETPVFADRLRLRLLRQNRHDLNAVFDMPRQYERVGWATTSNFLVRRAVFAELAGFDETVLTVVGGEDIDFGLRLTKAGYEVGCAPDAVVNHDPRSQDSARATLQRLYTYGRAVAWLCTRYPERRTVMVNPVATTALAAAVAVGVPPRSRRRAVAAAAVLAGALFVRDARRRYATADPRHRLLESAVSTLVGWAHSAGQFVGAIQLGRPAVAFHRFAYWDGESFADRESSLDRGAQRSGGEPEDQPAVTPVMLE